MERIQPHQLKQLVEAALFVSDKPLSIDRLKQTVLQEWDVPTRMVKDILQELELDYAPRGIVLQEVASGWRFQSSEALGPWLARLWEEPAPRYSRALLETLSLIAYRQPITRGEIEQIRGVAVSSNIIKTLVERDWIKTVGHKDVPGRPALYATTAQFLDYFSLTSLDELPDHHLFEADGD